MTSGIFITFEGGEGCGKSTQIKLLVAALQERGCDVLQVREPGGTAVGEKVRSILLDKANDGMDSLAELMLYEAARAQIVAEVIRPALDAGKVVLCDRFFDSTIAYQGYGRGLDPEMIGRLNMIATSGLVPDLTILLDMDVEAGLRRAKGVTGGDGEGDRIESAGLAFHQRIRAGFAALAQQHPERIALIDASGDIDTVAAQIAARVDALLA